MRAPGAESAPESAPVSGRESAHASAQAAVEVVAGSLATLLAGLVALQLLAAGYAVVMADHAAEAAALALANGRDAAGAARAAVPGWPEAATEVAVRGGTVSVTLRPPTALGFLRGRLAVTARAAVRPA